MNNQENTLAEDIILIDKPAGLSSFGVVARVRRRLSEQAGKKVKVGHTGTLDPFATGLLILLSNKATKMSSQFLKLDKWYEATICLGKTSTTGDPEGEITKQYPKRIPTLEEIETVVTSFIGQITQTVPAFSAVKINGRRAYQLARRGESVVMPTRQVEIYSLEVLSYNYPNLVIRTHVSSGTYVRTLGEDIGKALGTGAYLTSLRRTQIGSYEVSNAITLADFMSEE
ncbi:MAG: tRNA pseudouridine(55) synthase TruB [Candidatus Nanosyncoccus sp.]